MQIIMEKDAVNVPLRVSATINQLDGSLDLGENAQFLCHVEALRFRNILGTELQEGDQHPARSTDARGTPAALRPHAPPTEWQRDRSLTPEPRLLQMISLSP